MSETLITHVHWTCIALGPVSQLDASYSFVFKWAKLCDVNEYDNGFKCNLYCLGTCTNSIIGSQSSKEGHSKDMNNL